MRASVYNLQHTKPDKNGAVRVRFGIKLYSDSGEVLLTALGMRWDPTMGGFFAMELNQLKGQKGLELTKLGGAGSDKVANALRAVLTRCKGYTPEALKQEEETCWEGAVNSTGPKLPSGNTPFKAEGVHDDE